MNLPSRLRKLELAVAEFNAEVRRCSACGGPVPSVSGVLVLGPEGIHLMGPPCGPCSPHGGGGNVPLDLRTGCPEVPPKLILLGIRFERWLDLHGEKRFGGALHLTLHYHRAVTPDGAGEQKLTLNLTPVQRAEADSATQYFPHWEIAGTQFRSGPGGLVG